MDSNLRYAGLDTPVPGSVWLRLSDDERLTLVRDTLVAAIPAINDVLLVVDTKQDGQVIARLLEPLSADKRGTLLLDLELYLKDEIDQGLTVWLEPLGDRSSLRNLRGIEVKV